MTFKSISYTLSVDKLLLAHLFSLNAGLAKISIKCDDEKSSFKSTSEKLYISLLNIACFHLNCMHYRSKISVI